MKTVCVVRAIPVRRTDGSIGGWARVDPTADGSKDTDLVYLRDGTANGQAEALRRASDDPGLLYPTRDAAVRDGIARLREADRRGLAVRGSSRPAPVATRFGGCPRI